MSLLGFKNPTVNKMEKRGRGGIEQGEERRWHRWGHEALNGERNAAIPSFSCRVE
jgi:hypothetical protein